MVTRRRRTPPKQKGPGRSPGLLVTRCSLPDAARIRRHHRLPYLAAECLAELVEVLHRALGPPLACAVRIRLRQHPRTLLRLVLAPHLSKRDEEPSRRRVVILLAVYITRLGIRSALGQHFLQRLERNPDAAIVGCILAKRQMAIQILSFSHFEAVILLRLALG